MAPIRCTGLDLLAVGALAVARVREPSPVGLRELLDRLAAQHERLAKKLVLVAIIGAESTPPDAATREALVASIEQVYAHAGQVRIVHPGVGVRLAILRSVTTMLTLAVGLRGHPFFADKTVEVTAQKVELVSGMEAGPFLDLLVAEGMLSLEELA